MAGENNANPNDPKLPDSSGLLRMSDLGNKAPNYKSLPKNRKARNLNDNEPIMGHGSAFSSSRFNTDSERKDFANKRREGLKQGLVSSAGRALRGKRDLSHEDRELLSSGKNTADPEKRARLEQLRRMTGVRGAVNNMKRQVYQEALRFGSDKAFYWLLGLILPTFGLAILGLDILWLLGSRLGAQLKVWQKITIVLLNLLVLGLLFVLFLASMIYFCSVTIPFGTTIAKGLGQIGAPEYVTFCKYFDIGNIAAGISSGSSTGASGGGSSSSPSSTVGPDGQNAANSSNLRGAGIVPWTGPDPYPDLDFGDIDPRLPADVRNRLGELSSTFSSLKRRWSDLGNGNLIGRQAYRPQAYQNHIRSTLEVFRSSQGMSTRNSSDFGCEGYNSLPNNVWELMSEQEKAAARNEFRKHALSGSGYQIACLSDHAKGEAIDISIASLSPEKFRELVTEADRLGLCNSVTNDKPHFVLKKYASPNANCFINIGR